MSKKHTEKSVHIDPVTDQSILEELALELEGAKTASSSGADGQYENEQRTSGESGRRTARPYAEVKGGGEHKTIRQETPVKPQKEENDLSDDLEFLEESVARPRKHSVKPAEPVAEEKPERFDTSNLDEVLEFISVDNNESVRGKRRSPQYEPLREQPKKVSRVQTSRQPRNIKVEALEEALRKKRCRMWIIIPIIMLAALVFFAVSYYMFMESLTAMFLIPVVVTAVLTVLFILMQRGRRQGARVVGRILGLILAVILIVGGCGLTYLNLKLGHAMGQTDDSTKMVVIVRMDDPAQKSEDAKEYTFGYEDRTQPQSMEETIADIESHIGTFDRKEYESVEQEAQDLLDGDIDAVILNAIFIESLDDVIDDFSGQVRVIYTHEVAQAYLNMPPVKDGQSFNVLISGIDTYGEIASVSRSDVNQIMTVNPKKKLILLTSTPRDYYVKIPGISGEEKDKLTHAGIYGIQATADTLGELYDTDINYYVRINFTSLIEVVDALGGIDVNSEVAFSAGGYDFAEGVNHLNGEQALAFSRARHQFEEGDNQRGKNQQYVLTAILNKLMTREALSHPVELFDSLSQFVETNMTKGEFVRLAADLLASGETYSIDRTQATGEGGSAVTYSMPGRKLYVMYPDEESVAKIKQRIKAFLGEK